MSEKEKHSSVDAVLVRVPAVAPLLDNRLLYLIRVAAVLVRTKETFIGD